MDRWKDGINWFFRHAPKEDVADLPAKRGGQECPRSVCSGGADPTKASDETTANFKAGAGRQRGPQAQPARLKEREPAWRLKMVKGIRIRDMSYHTEKGYMSWLTRFARHWNTQDLEALGEKDIDLERNKLYVRASKGDKDRCVPLAKSLKEPLVAHLAEIRKVHDADRAAKRPGVYMPNALDKKMSLQQSVKGITLTCLSGHFDEVVAVLQGHGLAFQ